MALINFSLNLELFYLLKIHKFASLILFSGFGFRWYMVDLDTAFWAALCLLLAESLFLRFFDDTLEQEW